MLLFLKDQFNKLSNHLPWFTRLPVIPYKISLLKEKNTTASLPCNKELKELSFNFLFAYCIFPDNILTYCAEWQYQKRKMQVGDTIVQQIYFPAVKILSQKIIVGVRVKDVFMQDDLIEFSYETLKGHIEKGISSFRVLKINGSIKFNIHTHSRANNLFLHLLSPLLSSPYQDYCTRKVLHRMVQLFKKENFIV
jgi:Domain of unknown function (DUF1990)